MRLCAANEILFRVNENDEMRLCAANEILPRVNKNVKMRCVPMRYCPELTRMFR